MANGSESAGARSPTAAPGNCHHNTKEVVISAFRNSDFVVVLADLVEAAQKHASSQRCEEAHRLQEQIQIIPSSLDTHHRKDSGCERDMKEFGLRYRSYSTEANDLRACAKAREFSDGLHIDSVPLRFSAEITNESPELDFDATYEGGELFLLADDAGDEDATSQVSYVDKDGDRIGFSVQDNDLIMFVNGERRAGQNDNSGVVDELMYVPGHPADVRTQYGWGGSDMPLAIVRKLKKMADVVGVKNNLPDIHAPSNDRSYTSSPVSNSKKSTFIPMFASWGTHLHSSQDSSQTEASLDLASAKDEFMRMHRSYLRSGSGLFTDLNEMKDKVRKALLRDDDTRFEYKETGICQYIVRSHWFEYLTLAVVSINALWVAIETDMNIGKRSTDVTIVGVDSTFACFFVIEWLLRVHAFQRKCHAFRTRWFVFDSFVTALMVVDLGFAITTDMAKTPDTSVLKVLRMLRLTRVLRISRVLQALPEVAVLLKGIGAATKSVICTLCLLTILLFIFSVVFRQVTHGSGVGKKYFKSVPDGMYNLLLYGTLPDMADMVENVAAEHILLAVMMLLFILCASLTVMNMLVGVLVEVVSVVSAMEKEERKVWSVKSKLMILLMSFGLDVDEDLLITRKAFEMLIQHPTAVRAIEDVGVDPVALVDYTDAIFKDSPNGITFPTLIEVLLQLRGSNLCTVKDMIDLRRFLFQELTRTEKTLKTHNSYLKKLTTSTSSQQLGTQSKRSSRRVSLPVSCEKSGESTPGTKRNRAKLIFGDAFQSNTDKKGRKSTFANISAGIRRVSRGMVKT